MSYFKTLYGICYQSKRYCKRLEPEIVLIFLSGVNGVLLFYEWHTRFNNKAISIIELLFFIEIQNDDFRYIKC